jgi:hypothetical protein
MASRLRAAALLAAVLVPLDAGPALAAPTVPRVPSGPLVPTPTVPDDVAALLAADALHRDRSGGVQPAGVHEIFAFTPEYVAGTPTAQPVRPSCSALTGW